MVIKMYEQNKIETPTILLSYKDLSWSLKILVLYQYIAMILSIIYFAIGFIKGFWSGI